MGDSGENPLVPVQEWGGVMGGGGISLPHRLEGRFLLPPDGGLQLTVF